MRPASAKRLTHWTLLAALLGATLTGCGAGAEDTPGTPTTAQNAAGSTYPNTDEGAKALMQALGTGNDPTLVQQLKPTTADYQAVFEGDVAAKAEQYYKAKLWNGSEVKIAAKPEQTDLKVFKATTEEIRSWSSAVAANFPGGYQQIGPHLKPGLTVYRWKYTEPGDDLGLAFEGLVNVNGRWVWVPKVWQVLES
ncbi:hypothetical protein ACQP1P_45615 [Dactylosporangium sp. CA-052675]|uniref:hypothetical protein n=1 Tax=Dactylosporangium sp. CA-052675 TaxID=3239927 RepID=UPI003D8A0EEA